MMRTSPRSGFTMIETALFLGILAIMGTVVIGVLIATQTARIRQQSIAALEQRGTQVLQSLTRTIRRAEAIQFPASNTTGSIIALQMALNTEYPTIFAASGGNVLMVEKDQKSFILSGPVTIGNLSFRNIGGASAVVSFDLTATIPLPKPQIYTRHFEGNVTLFPDDQSESGGCGTCPTAACINHLYKWYFCTNDVCQQSVDGISC